MVSNKTAITVAELIIPYLQVKQEQARLFIEFGNTVVGKGIPISPDKWKVRESIRERMKLLNKRGV